jgi:hypothetical protein
MPRPDSGSTEIDWLTVEDPEQARLLSDPGAFRFFEPFLARERTVTAAAVEAGCSVDTMLYRVRKFLKAGLLRISRVETRAGRPIKHYRSVADALFVPFSATPYATLEERIENQFAPFNRTLIRSVAHLLRHTGRDGRRIYRHPDGEVWNDSAADPETPFRMDDEDLPAAYDFSTEIELELSEAKALQRELHELFERYAKRRPGRGQSYLWHLSLMPVRPR